MDLTSPNLKLPYLAPAQAQKHVTHNEALRQLDAIVQLSVLAVQDSPPSAPQNGVCFIVGADPIDDFAEKAHHIASFQDGAWSFLAPNTGWRSYVEERAEFRVFDGLSWQALTNGGAPDNVMTLGINTQADETNRLSLKSPATLLDNEGAGHQLKINKSQPSDVASLVFQSGYAGHVEIGLTGDQDLHIKVSSDGQSFKEALSIDHKTGTISTPQGFNSGVMTSPTNQCGGPDSFYGFPSVTSIVRSRGNFTFAANRMIFTAIYVDRDSQLEGGRVAQYSPCSTAGAIMRCGLYHLGSANGTGWDIGTLIYDFGTVAADIAGHKLFDLGAPLTLPQGWYAFAVGVNASGAAVRYIQTRQPGMGYVQPHGSGSSADYRFAGPTSYLLDSSMKDEIENGLSENWPSNPLSMVASVNGFAYNIFIPKWAVFT